MFQSPKLTNGFGNGEFKQKVVWENLFLLNPSNFNSYITRDSNCNEKKYYCIPITV